MILCGIGRMGRNHFRVIRESPRFRLVGIVDPALAAEQSTLQGVAVASEANEIDDEYSAAVLATPTETHRQDALELIALGKHLLIEKPLASTVAQCNEIRDAAQRQRVHVGVGHVERFNPAVSKIKETLASGLVGEPIHYSFTRVGGYPERVKEGNNALLDLAVHDLDILQMLAGPVSLIASVCHSTVQPSVLDTSEMLLRCESGASASIHVNWVTPTKIRTLRITCSKGVIVADLILQTCVVFGGNLLRRGPEPQLDFAQLAEEYRNSDKIELGVRREEPLCAQLEAFATLLAGGQSALCPMAEATRSVELAEEAIAAGQIHHVSGAP